jgi:hypothetical protein
MTDHWTDRLSEYIDDDLAPDQRRQIDAHLQACGDCAEIVRELRAVAARAAALPPRTPTDDLWPGVKARLGSRFGAQAFERARASKRFSFTLPELVAAGLALMVLSGSGVWILQHGGRATTLPPTMAAAHQSPDEPADAGSIPVAFADPHYDRAVADLERALESGRSRLDTETIRVLERNLATIDRAIDDSRQALARDPSNAYLNTHLADARQRKLDLLRQAAALTGMTTGS